MDVWVHIEIKLEMKISETRSWDGSDLAGGEDEGNKNEIYDSDMWWGSEMH